MLATQYKLYCSFRFISTVVFCKRNTVSFLIVSFIATVIFVISFCSSNKSQYLVIQHMEVFYLMEKKTKHACPFSPELT